MNLTITFLVLLYFVTSRVDWLFELGCPLAAETEIRLPGNIQNLPCSVFAKPEQLGDSVSVVNSLLFRTSVKEMQN
jgi:hypothetical protein